MTTLGPGVRVAIGWTPDEKCSPEGRQSRLQKGTIHDGPFGPGERLPAEYRDGCGRWRRNGTGENMWVVMLDSGRRTGTVEHLLIPLDGGDPVEVDKPEEVEA